MKYLFPAMERRFKADATLLGLMRKMYRGFVGQPLKANLPYVEVSAIDRDPIDTFDSDVEIVTIEVGLFTKGPTPFKIDNAIEEFVRVFDDCKLETSKILVFGFEKQPGSTGPFIEDGTYRATLSYLVYTERVDKRPHVRATI